MFIGSRPIRDGWTGDVAADHWPSLADDLAILSDLGLASPSPDPWPSRPRRAAERPRLTLRPSCRFICRAGIEPFVNLFHWDLPCAAGFSG
jgi:hypothetical protein